MERYCTSSPQTSYAFHGIRFTFTLKLNKGKGIKVIQEQCEHATTVNTNPTHKEKAQAGALINEAK